MVGEEPLRSGQRILSYFKCASLYINGHDLPLVASFDLWTDMLGIDFIATPCMFFFTVAWLPHLHNFSFQVGKEGFGRVLPPAYSAASQVTTRRIFGMTANLGRMKGEHNGRFGNAASTSSVAIPCSGPSGWIQSFPSIMSMWTRHPCTRLSWSQPTVMSR